MLHAMIGHLPSTLAMLGALALGGCAEVYHGHPVHDPAPAVEIPPGHLPPPGSCRIWFPDRPPGQQPPPSSCRDLRYRVPPGAVLVYG